MKILRTNTIFLLIGLFFCVFALFFLITGYDEIWNGHSVWWLGVGWAATLISIGIFSLLKVFNPAKRVFRFAVVFVIASLLLLIFGMVNSLIV